MPFASCDDNTTPLLPSFEEIGRQAYSIRESQDSLQIQLDGVNLPVESIVSTIDWLDISDNGTDTEGNLRLLVKRLKPAPYRFVSDSAYICFAKNRRFIIVINSADEITPSSDNEQGGLYDAFNKEWWKQEEILYSGTRTINGAKETTSEHIPLPWAPATTSNIPPVIFQEDEMSTNEGWVMAYNLFAAETGGNPNSKPYFMLYNKYTGILRVFYYQFEQAGTGGEFSFAVTPDIPSSPKFPYYHCLQYAIPMSNDNVQLKGNVLKITKGNNGFQQMVSPYLKADVALKPGWYCFDLDWSAYAPGQTAPFLSSDRLSIDCMTSSNSTITLAGVLNGKLDGSMEGTENSSTYSSSGSCYAGSLDKGFDAVAKLAEGKWLEAAFGGISSLWSLERTIVNNPAYTTKSKSTGKINMSFTGEIDLSGYITSNTSNNAVGVEFAPTAFAQSKEAGQGVWSLEENPVVYVVNDLLMGEDEDFVCHVTSDCYSIGAEDPSSNNLRLLTFLDPRTIKFNINTALYKDIRDVKMSWTFGVYPNQKAGHTDQYRFGLMDFRGRGLMDEPVFIDKAANNGKVYKSFSSGFANMEYLEFPLEQVPTTWLVSSTKPKIYKQEGSDYRYYGEAGNNLPETDKDFFVVDPVVFLPTSFEKEKESDTYGAGKVYDFQAPDFVVGVALRFKHTLPDGSEATSIHTQRFLPCLKGISAEELGRMRKELRDYVDSKTHQTLDNGVAVEHEGAGKMLERFFQTSLLIELYDYHND